MSRRLTPFLLAAVVAALPHAAFAAACAAPDWAPKALAGFRIASCDEKTWAAVDLDLADGPKTVFGRRWRLNYELADEKKNPAADTARSFYEKQAEKNGAKLMSQPGGYNATLTKSSAAGEFWYVYEHGSGNEDSTSSYTLTTLQVAPLPQEASAKPMAAPFDPKSAACADPPWLAATIANFKRSACEARNWDSVSLALVDGDRTVEGERLAVSYELVDQDKAPTAIQVAKNFVNALQAIGAKLVSDPNSIWSQAVLTQTLPFGSVWYIYRHGDGNDDTTLGYRLATIIEKPFPQEVAARAMPPEGLQRPGKACADPPWILRQFGAFQVSTCDYRDFDTIKLDLPDGEKILAGRILRTDYRLADGAQPPVAKWATKNYLNALGATGATILSAPDDAYRVVATTKTDKAEFWLLYAQAGGNDNEAAGFELTTVQIGGAPPKSCTLEVYGVNFDFNKAVLRDDSAPVLEQLHALFAGDPAFAAEIGGHTDNVGGADYNLKLSNARAGAVKAWLVDHGVAASRLAARGYGDTKPLVPNTNDENRAKNRRVELKRAHCTE